LQPEPKYQTQSYITYIYMSIRKVSVSVTIQPTAKAQRTQRRKAEVEKMRSWEAGKLRSWEISTSQLPILQTSFSLRTLRLCGELLPVLIREDTDVRRWAQKDSAKTEERQGKRSGWKGVYSLSIKKT